MSSNPFDVIDDEHDLLVQQTKLEDSMLGSTRRAIALLTESEEVGTKSAAELVEQGQALERISKKLDEADDTLSETQQNITALRSPLAGFGSKLLSKLSPKRKHLARGSGKAAESPLEKYLSSGASGDNFHGSTASLPVLPSAGGSDQAIGNIQQSGISAREVEIEGNLDTMSKYLCGLKDLAVNMGQEIDRQNEFIVGIKESSEKVDVKIAAQRDALQKILKK